MPTSNKTFPIGSEYSVDSYGRLYRKDCLVEAVGSHSYGVYINQLSFFERKIGKYIEKRGIAFLAGDGYDSKRMEIEFIENDLNFNNLDWRTYKKQLKDFLGNTFKKTKTEKVETLF